MEDTSICVSRVVDLHVEVDLVVRLGSMMQHESTRRQHEYAGAYSEE
jgi:hypothetical protein